MKIIKINKALIASVGAFICLNMAFIPTSFAQNGGTGNFPAAVSGQSKAILTDTSALRNATGSCDSTCDAMGASAPAASVQSAFMTRVSACGTGYTGNKTQTRTQNPDGSLTPWVDGDTSLCVCSSTFEDRPGVCSAPTTGGYSTERRNWVCTGNVGAWTSYSVIANNCFTPCATASPSTQTQSLSCGGGMVGAINQSRNSSCPGGVGSNSTAVWSSWSTTSNSCYVPCAPAATQYQGLACPATYTGGVYQSRVSYCPGGNGANSSPTYAGWTTYSNTCTHAYGKPLGAPYCQGDMYDGGQVMSLWRTFSNGAGGTYQAVVATAGCTPGYMYAESGPYGAPIGGMYYAGSPYYWTPADNDNY